jgi:hypothetical protein
MSDFDHTWDFTVKAPMKEEKSVVKLKSVGGVVTGSMDSKDHGLQEIEEGTFDGDTIIWKSKVTKPMKLTLTYTATLDEAKNLSGELKVAMAKMKISGELVS